MPTKHKKHQTTKYRKRFSKEKKNAKLKERASYDARLLISASDAARRFGWFAPKPELTPEQQQRKMLLHKIAHIMYLRIKDEPVYRIDSVSRLFGFSIRDMIKSLERSEATQNGFQFSYGKTETVDCSSPACSETDGFFPHDDSEKNNGESISLP